MRHNKFRFIYMALLGLGLSILFRFGIFKGLNQHPYIVDVLVTISITIAIWEGNLHLDHYLNKKLPWQTDAKKRVVLQFFLALMYNAFVLGVSMYSYHCYLCVDNDMANRLMQGSIVMSLFISFMLLAIEIGTQFFNHWKLSLVEVEKYKTESAHAQLQNLKNQINPHFLFNNLSVLSSLVYKNQDKAVEFIHELSRVYRYVLDNRNTELVSLTDELSFLNHYIYLLKIRFEDHIQFYIHIDEDCRTYYVLPMCLQMLVENAIKHNVVSKEHPLKITIHATDLFISVSNPVFLRSFDEPSNKSGLRNICDRYQYYSEENVIIHSSADLFEVKLPLISKR